MIARVSRWFVVMVALAGCADESPSGLTATGACASSAACDDGVACTRDVCTVDRVCEHVPDDGQCPSGQTCGATGCAPAGSTRCAATADCDDRVACTRDVCLVEGFCQRTPRDEMCPAGQSCDATRGCVAASSAQCRSAADCDDSIPCTEDTCTVSGACAHTAQNARCAMGQRCLAGMGCVVEAACSSDRDCDDGLRCNGAERCSELACVAGEAVSCDDGVACTVDACQETGEMCAHTTDPTCMGTAARSGFYDLEGMPVAYRCSAAGVLTVVDFSFTALQVVVGSASLTVNGAPVPMTGSLPSGTGAFRVSGTMAGDCNEVYTLDGVFTTATRFMGTFSVSFAGVSCGLTDCAERRWPVVGTARM
ncbi:MAG: hypothetical protein R3A52_01320 [Polyangiales bacterium]